MYPLRKVLVLFSLMSEHDLHQETMNLNLNLNSTIKKKCICVQSWNDSQILLGRWYSFKDFLMYKECLYGHNHAFYLQAALKISN